MRDTSPLSLFEDTWTLWPATYFSANVWIERWVLNDDYDLALGLALVCKTATSGGYGFNGFEKGDIVSALRVGLGWFGFLYI